MELTRGITLDDDVLAELCRRHGIRRLALFGSALHDELRPDSDIDLLVEFAPGHTPGLLGIAAIELELERLVERRVDLRTPGDLSRYFRDTVTAEARPLYDAA
jgi:predicted nucleotidyltransferase